MSVALVITAGKSLTKALSAKLAERTDHVVLASRNPERWKGAVEQIGGSTLRCDPTKARDVAALFEAIDDIGKPLDVIAYLPSAGERGSIVSLDPDAVALAMNVTATGAFLVAQQAASRMITKKSGALLFAGATASKKGFAGSAPFAMGEFALRGLCQSLARELHPLGVHVGHVVIDGTIADCPFEQNKAGAEVHSDLLCPQSVADAFASLLDQQASSWSWELEIRPSRESF